jgi:hypothetical protein
MHRASFVAISTILLSLGASLGCTSPVEDANASTPDLSPVTSLSPPSGRDFSLVAGGDSTCVLRGGNVTCWGALVTGPNQSITLPPTHIRLPESAIQIAVAADHACALTRGWGVFCWGEYLPGQFSERATEIAFSSRSRAVSVGDGTTCALDEVGAVRCVGRNEFGQARAGDYFRDRTTIGDLCKDVPAVQPVPLGKPATSVVTAGGHACAQLNDGTTTCWGDNREGQAPQSDFAPESAGKALAIFAAGNTTCNLYKWELSGGSGLVCRGAKNADWSRYASEAYSIGQCTWPSSKEIAVGPNHICTFDRSRIECSGANTFGEAPGYASAAGSVQVLQMAVGNHHTCASVTSSAADEAPRVFCFGANESGQLGVPGPARGLPNQGGEVGDGALVAVALP